MRSYEQALSIWASRIAGIPERDDRQVSFTQESWTSSGGCPTCDHGRTTEITNYVIVDDRSFNLGDREFGDVIREVVEVARENV